MQCAEIIIHMKKSALLGNVHRPVCSDDIFCTVSGAADGCFCSWCCGAAEMSHQKVQRGPKKSISADSTATGTSASFGAVSQLEAARDFLSTSPRGFEVGSCSSFGPRAPVIATSLLYGRLYSIPYSYVIASKIRGFSVDRTNAVMSVIWFTLL